jgi:hypothetical protein
MITNETILELVKFHFEEGGVRDDGSCSEYYGTPKDFIDFARQIRRETLREILSALRNVPNPGENQTAISRIKMELI